MHLYISFITPVTECCIHKQFILLYDSIECVFIRIDPTGTVKVQVKVI